MQIEFPLALTGLLTLIPIFFLMRWNVRRRKELCGLLLQGDSHLARQTLSNFLFVGIAVLSLVMVIAKPAIVFRSPEMGKRGNAILLLDTSRSMAAQETPQSSSQFSRAKAISENAIREVPEACFGIFVFAQVAFPVTSLTCDRQILSEAMERSVFVDSVPRRGSEVVSVLAAVVTRIISPNSIYGDATDIVLLTDGGAFSAEYLPLGMPQQLVNVVKESNIRIIIVGVGSKAGAPIPLFDDKGIFTGEYERADFKRMIFFLQEPFLRAFAEQVGGTYINGEDDSKLVEILRNDIRPYGGDPLKPAKQDVRWVFLAIFSASFFVLLWKRYV